MLTALAGHAEAHAEDLSDTALASLRRTVAAVAPG
jgi:hypothetical protein